MVGKSGLAEHTKYRNAMQIRNKLETPTPSDKVRPMRLYRIAPYLIASALVLIAAYYGTSKSLGAHPFWSVKVAWNGAPIGLAAAFLLRSMAWTRRLGLTLIALIFSATAAHQGRLIFAASYAENHLAGLFWYYGWIAVAASSAALISVILTPARVFR